MLNPKLTPALVWALFTHTLVRMAQREKLRAPLTLSELGPPSAVYDHSLLFFPGKLRLYQF